MSLRRHVLQVVAVVTAMAMLFGAFAGSASAKRMSSKQRAHARAQLLRQVKKNPRIVRKRSFLRRAALVNFVLPITIRLRNQCSGSSLINYTACGPDKTNGTALNQTRDPSATIDLGPSLGQRTIALSGSLAGEVQFHDSFDGGALGNVSLKILPSQTKTLQTSSVPLLWNPDVSDPATRFDRGLMAAVRDDSVYGAPVSAYGNTQTQGCGDWQAQNPQAASAYNPASTHNPFAHNTRATSPIATTALTGVPPGDGSPGYDALFADVPYDFNFGTGIGVPGFPYYPTAAAAAPAPLLNISALPTAFLPVYPGVDRIDNLQSGGETGNNEILGPSQTPFPYSANIRPGGFTQPPDVRSTVLRTNALSLTVAPAGISVNQATGTSDGGPTAPHTTGPEGSQNIVTGQSGGEANLFGNIPGKNVAIDVTVNLATAINSIIRIQDQDLFKLPLVSGDPYPAGLFNCRQVWTGAVQNYIPGVRLEGSLRISPAITKDGKLRIAKATVQSPTVGGVPQPTGVALAACVMPYSAYVENNTQFPSQGYSTDANAAEVPFNPLGGRSQDTGLIDPLAPTGTQGLLLIPYNSDLLPGNLSKRRYGVGANPGRGNAPSNVPCNTAPTNIIQQSSLTAPVTPQTAPTAGDGYSTTADGSKVSVRGDIAVNPIDVDVLIGDV